MNLESLHWQHWLVLGLIAGLLIGLGRMQAELDRPIGGQGFISQASFERELRLPPIMGKAYITSMSIHPGRYADLVSLRELDPQTLSYQDRWFAAQKPYHPLLSPGGTADGNTAAGPVAGTAGNLSIRDYLIQLAAANPRIRVRLAWWDSPGATVIEWALIGAAVLGGAWPPVLRLLIGAGLGRKKEADTYDLGRFHHGPEKPGARRELSDEERRRLEELEAEMMAGLGKSPVAPSAMPAEPPGAVHALADEPLQPVPDAPADQKDYGGQYYPVEKNAPHGFSMVELIVVMGIIAILISLLMPTIITAQRHAQTAQCAGNLRQIGMALQSYAGANRGWLPAWSGWHTWPPGASDDSPGPAWTIELMPYIGRPDSPVYNCPSFPSRLKCRNYFLAAQWSGKSGRHAMKLTDVTMASRFVLSGDKTQRGLYPPPFGSSEHLLDDADPDDNGSGMPVLAWPWDPGGFFMHQGGNNVLFDDMHVALFAGYDKDAMTFNPHRLENWADVTAD